jgi:type II secretory pathway component PulF
MLSEIELFFAKREFLSRRGEVYDLIYSNLEEQGSRQISTLRELFARWEQRESKRGSSIALVYKSIIYRLNRGGSFSQAISLFIPIEEALIIEAGDASGTLLEALSSAKKQFSSDKEINGIVAAAMAEPMMTLLSILATSFFCGSFLWPQLLAVIKERFWPWWCLPLIHFEIAVVQYWQISSIAVILILAYYWTIPRWTGYARQCVDHLPPWSLYRDRQAIACIGILAGLLSSGMELSAALERVASKSTPWMSWQLRKIKSRMLSSGENTLRAFDSGLFSREFVDLIEDASRNRSFDLTLQYLGSEALPRVVQKVKTLAKTMAALMAIFFGLVFLYQMSVQQLGMNEAARNFSNSQT